MIQLGIIEIGKKVLLANISGRLSRFTTAICVSHRVDLIAISRNIDDNPRQIKKITIRIPTKFTTWNVGLRWSPNNKARIMTIAAWKIDRRVAENTFEKIIAPR